MSNTTAEWGIVLFIIGLMIGSVSMSAIGFVETVDANSNPIEPATTATATFNDQTVDYGSNSVAVAWVNASVNNLGVLSPEACQWTPVLTE